MYDRQPNPIGKGTHLFVYGSLVSPEQLDAVLGHRHTGERLRARLVGYRRVQVDAYAYPFIVPAAGDAVDGVLVMDLSAADMQCLDDYEEVSQGTYERAVVEVEAWGCGPLAMHIAAWTYVGGRELARLAVETGAASAQVQRAPILRQA